MNLLSIEFTHNACFIDQFLTLTFQDLINNEETWLKVLSPCLVARTISRSLWIGIMDKILTVEVKNKLG